MRILRYGSTGPAVQLLQLALARAGVDRLARDGIFGAQTRRAVIDFQRREGLSPDGIVGSQTHRRLLAYYLGYTAHRIRAGDTLAAIAARYKTRLSAVLTANPDLVPERLRIGDSVIVPFDFPVVPTDIAWFSALTGYCVRGLAARYPFITVSDIGRSVMGRPLWHISLGDGQNTVMYNAGHHANEWITTPVLLKFTEELAAARAERRNIFNVSAQELLAYSSLHLIPAVNPDGIDLVTGELSDGEYYTRAMRIAADYPSVPFPSGWKANILGVDLNLQYPALWEQAKENKFALGVVSPAPADYVGVAPLTAPEARAMYSATLRLRPALILAYHTQGEVIYWKYLDREPPHSRDIAQTLSAASGYAMEETPFASAFAGYKDWFIQSFDRPGYTVEAGRGENPLPLHDFDEIYRQNLGLLTLAAALT